MGHGERERWMGSAGFSGVPTYLPWDRHDDRLALPLVEFVKPERETFGQIFYKVHEK